jgi:CFEM domain
MHSLVLVAALAQAALAQVIAPPPGTPQCLITCSGQYCPTAEQECICVTEFQNITLCVLSSCSGSDLTTAESLAPQLCRKIPASDAKG